MTTDNKVDPAFAAAVATILNPNLQAEQVYAAAFADATKQIQAGLESSKTLAGEIRARAAQLNELADLIDTTLAAAAMPCDDSPSKDGAGEVSNDKVAERPEEDAPRSRGASEDK